VQSEMCEVIEIKVSSELGEVQFNTQVSVSKVAVVEVQVCKYSSPQ
jgi:hypothetical protein